MVLDISVLPTGGLATVTPPLETDAFALVENRAMGSEVATIRELVNGDGVARRPERSSREGTVKASTPAQPSTSTGGTGQSTPSALGYEETTIVSSPPWPLTVVASADVRAQHLEVCRHGHLH